MLEKLVELMADCQTGEDGVVDESRPEVCERPGGVEPWVLVQVPAHQT